MKGKPKRHGHKWVISIGVVIVLFLGTGIVLLSPWFQPWWENLVREGRTLFGGRSGRIPPEEKRIREELILKRMDETSIRQDWKDLVPEYPRATKAESSDPKDLFKSVKDSPAFKETDQEVKQFLTKRGEALFRWDPPLPPLKGPLETDGTKDKATDQVLRRLQVSKGKGVEGKVIEENLQLGMTGPLLYRRIIERPPPPQVKVKVEGEIELTVWVLPNGSVDRAVPSVRGDPELERVAIQYIKQWRFEPLPKDQPQVEQSGTVPIKFKLQ